MTCHTVRACVGEKMGSDRQERLEREKLRDKYEAQNEGAQLTMFYAGCYESQAILDLFQSSCVARG